MNRPPPYGPDALARIERARQMLDSLELVIRADRRRRGLPETDTAPDASATTPDLSIVDNLH